jgi:hypothetical protein
VVAWTGRAGAWRRLAAAAFGALIVAGLAAAPAQARWLRAESPHFVVYSDGDETKMRAAVQQLETFDWLLRYQHGVKDDGVASRKLNVYLVREHDELNQVYTHIPDTIRGFYVSTLGDTVDFAMLDDPDFRPDREMMGHLKQQQTFAENPQFHEYTHHFMRQYFPYDYPQWLSEGYAEYFGSTTVEGQRIEFAKFDLRRVQSLINERWLPLESLVSNDPRQIVSFEQRNFYPQAWLLTHWFMSTPERRQQLRAYMLAMGRGEDSAKALQAATGLSIEALTAALHTYIRGDLTYQLIVRKPTDAAPVTITAMPASADAMLLEAERGRIDGSSRSADSAAKAKATGKNREEWDARSAAYLSDIRRDAAKFPGDSLAQMALARAEVLFGDRKAGEALLDQRLKVDPNDVEALELAGSARLDEADENPARAKALALEAQPFLGRAYKLDPTRYQTLWTYVRSRKGLDQPYPSDNTLEALLAALEYAPQNTDVRLEATRAMMRRQRWRDAAAIVTLEVNAPHKNKDSEAAALLREIRTHEPAATPSPPAPAH